MKINPPDPIIDENDPFKDALFGRHEFAESITNLLRNVTESIVVFVNAPWGEGKTTFAKMWRAYLKNKNHEVIYFDAYASDYVEDPFVSFSGEILDFIDKKIPDGKALAERREFKETAVEVVKRLAGLGAKIGLRAATLGAIESAHVDELTEIGAEVASGFSEIGADIVEKKIEEYSKEKDALKKFRETLAKLAAKVRAEQGFPLTIIVDELDRCRPDFALGLLERIKHLFDVEGVAFVLLVNRGQIENYIQTVYGGVDARAYMLKFGNLFVDLPSRQSSFSIEYQKGRQDYCEILFTHFGFRNRFGDARTFKKSITLLVAHFKLTLREIEKAFATMALFYASDNPVTDPFLVPVLSVLKVKQPELYSRLSEQTISAGDFFKETSLDQLADTEDIGFQRGVTETLQCCLMSDSEFSQATRRQGGQVETQAPLERRAGMLSVWNVDRKKIIPYLCTRLDLFAPKPK